MARLKAEVERLETELKETKESQATAIATAITTALDSRDAAWSERLRAEQAEWSAYVGQVEARWEGRFARLEAAQAVCQFFSTACLIPSLGS